MKENRLSARVANKSSFRIRDFFEGKREKAGLIVRPQIPVTKMVIAMHKRAEALRNRFASRTARRLLVLQIAGERHTNSTAEREPARRAQKAKSK